MLQATQPPGQGRRGGLLTGAVKRPLGADSPADLEIELHPNGGGWGVGSPRGAWAAGGAGGARWAWLHELRPQSRRLASEITPGIYSPLPGALPAPAQVFTAFPGKGATVC